MSSLPKRPRVPLVAAALSLCCPGLGQIYCGRLALGSTIVMLSLSSAPAAALVACQAPSRVLLVGLTVWTSLVVGTMIFAVVHAFLLARGAGDDFTPRPYNRGIVYAVLIGVTLVLGFGGTLQLRHAYLHAFRIRGASMEPLLRRDEIVLANKRRALLSVLRRGDVVVFHPPHEPRLYYIRRVAGLAGDSVTVRGEQTVVPEGYCYLRGDNPHNQHDSRSFGFVALSALVGRVDYIVWPQGGWQRFGPVPAR